MTVDRCMTRNPITITADVSVPEAQAIMRREKISRLPVLDKRGKLIGIVTVSDLIHASPSTATSLDIYELHYLISKLKVETVMTKQVLTTSADTAIEEAARLMADNNISGLPVVRGDVTVGIITESDLFRLFIELFGARHRGVRLTVLLPEKKGELAALTSVIASVGGNIISLATFEGEDPTSSFCTIKVEGVEREALIAAVMPVVDKIVDVRN